MYEKGKKIQEKECYSFNFLQSRPFFEASKRTLICVVHEMKCRRELENSSSHRKLLYTKLDHGSIKLSMVANDWHEFYRISGGIIFSALYRDAGD